eukprot:scaffold3791_cov76-Phaeocystis_antarctica.AAC.1
MVTPCPDRFHTRRELFLIGLLEALPVCPMALLVFIDFLSGPPGALRSARSRLSRGRGRGSARQMGSRLVYWTSCNLQGCILSRRRMFRPPRTQTRRRQPPQGTPGGARRAYDGFSPTFWLARHTWAAKGAMKTSRPVDARLWAARRREDPGLQSELESEYTRPTGGCCWEVSWEAGRPLILVLVQFNLDAGLEYHPQLVRAVSFGLGHESDARHTVL